MIRVEPGVTLGVVLACTTGCGLQSQPQTQLRELPNGIRVAVVHFPRSTNVSIFTFTSMGLAGDGPDQAQWSHLVQHLVIPTTVPGDLTHANAETQPDHMRLDTYGMLTDWKEWLSHHRRWLEGIPFTEASLQEEKPCVIAECDNTAKNLATHKFAVAAWDQAFRHGKSQAALKGDVTRATLAEVQAFRDREFAAPGRVTVCVVGGVDPSTAVAEIQKQLADLKLTAKPPSPVKPRAGSCDVTWDLDARHLLITWPIPSVASDDYASLMVAGPLLTTRFTAKPESVQPAGMVLCGADLLTAEGNFFYVSASLPKDASIEELKKRLQEQLTRVAEGNDFDQSIPIAKQLEFSLTQVADPAMMKSSLPPGTDLARLEGNIGLMYGLNAHRYGAQREILAKNLAKVSAEKVRQAVQKYLSVTNSSVCSIRGN